MKNKRKNIKFHLLTAIFIVIILSAGWVLFVRLEGGKPDIALEFTSPYIGELREIPIIVTDYGSGVRKIWIGLLKDGKEITLYQKSFPATGLLRVGMVKKEQLTVSIAPDKLAIGDGKAIFRMVAWDYSWKGWFHGNRMYIEKEVIIDTKPPEIDILSRSHNVSQGGACLIIYRVSEKTSQSGVNVGGNLFPGHSGYYDDPTIFISLFALNFKKGRNTEMFVQSTDLAGNKEIAGFSYYIREKTFKKDMVNISDQFLSLKMPEFDTSGTSSSSLFDKFLRVNRTLRLENNIKITGSGAKTKPVMYWEGTFLRLPNSATTAGYADYRTYKYKGRVRDNQVHLGIDLASIGHSPVPASNNGIVILAESVGIYGKTIVIDHGFGLMSTYSHLSRIDVQEKHKVSKGDIIGRTGNTGLAGGDHLHFGIFIHNTFVNPLEWWDKSWIKNNITNKINDIN